MKEIKQLHNYILVLVLFIVSSILLAFVKIETAYSVIYFIKNEYAPQTIGVAPSYAVQRVFVEDEQVVKKGDPILLLHYTQDIAPEEKYRLIQKYIDNVESLTETELKAIDFEIKYIRSIRAKTSEENRKIRDKKSNITDMKRDALEYMKYLKGEKDNIPSQNMFYENYQGIRNKLRSTNYTDEQKQLLRDEEKNKINDFIISKDNELTNYIEATPDNEILSYFAQLYLQTPNESGYEQIIYAEIDGIIQLKQDIQLNQEYTIAQEVVDIIPTNETVKAYVGLTPTILSNLRNTAGYFVHENGDKINFAILKEKYSYQADVNMYYVEIELPEIEQYLNGEQGVANVSGKQETLIDIMINMIFKKEK